VAILIRPVREQLEHDRIIRILQAKYKRKHDAVVNVGDEKAAPIKVGANLLYPDLVLNSAQPPRKMQGLVEVETGESVNHLEAMAEWAHFSRTRAAFYLYVPVGSVEIARHLCQEYQVTFAEMWAYQPLGDEIHFTLVKRNPHPELAGGKEPPAPPKGGTAKGGPAAAKGKAGAKPARVPKPAAKKPTSKKPTPKKPAAKKPAARKPAPARSGLTAAKGPKAAAAKSTARPASRKPARPVAARPKAGAKAATGKGAKPASAKAGRRQG
jgi:hypothetical protein